MLGVFQFTTFTTSRWISIGDSCRHLIGALSIGVSELVAMIRKDKATSDYYIKGFAQLPEALPYARVAAVAAHLCDHLLLAVMKDDRLALRVNELKDITAQELRWMDQIGDYAWSRLAGLAGDIAAN
eukprot:1923587-Lingulodinium_polyedra.AAC.1